MCETEADIQGRTSEEQDKKAAAVTTLTTPGNARSVATDICHLRRCQDAVMDSELACLTGCKTAYFLEIRY
jgi:hypothetical protein